MRYRQPQASRLKKKMVRVELTESRQVVVARSGVGVFSEFFHPVHTSSRGLVVGGIATSLRVPPVVRLGRLGRRGGEQGTRL